ncbi:hypothetical protein FD754_006057 [Muntiacus muntjak]|uniref:D-aminoacyl-tRNA deacylase n=1 Tax=Muntiacus muntjak TaxID=9888 RepID=A0A5N3WJH2_MUNMU|nr:hypothetical protein FD754_006057 [Muntiacus muntjak]
MQLVGQRVEGWGQGEPPPPPLLTASIAVGGEQVGAIRWVIGVLLGISLEDTQKELEHAESGKHWPKSVMDKQYDGNEPNFHLAMPTGEAEAFYRGFLEPLCRAERPELIKDGKFSASLQVHIQNDGPVTREPGSPAPGAVASDPEHLSKLEKQQQRTEKARAKGPSESSKKRSAARKEDHKASSRAEGDMSSEQEPVGRLGSGHYH